MFCIENTDLQYFKYKIFFFVYTCIKLPVYTLI